MTDKSLIRTYSGIFFSPLAPSPEDIVPEDIAHALSLMCRANGHFRSFYSVGQHCLSCEAEAHAAGLPRETRLACLIHDASEAYISDITRPVKLGLPEYRVIEKRLQDAIYRRFGIDPVDERIMREVTRIDDAMLYHEFLSLAGHPLFDVAPLILTRPDYGFVPFVETEKQYMSIFKELYTEETR